MKTIHPVPCYAMRFVEEKTGAVFVFTGDSGYLESFNEFAKKADLFLADTYLFDGNEKHKQHILPQAKLGHLRKMRQLKS